MKSNKIKVNKSKAIALLQLPCEFGIINQSEALIPYEIDLNI